MLLLRRKRPHNALLRCLFPVRLPACPACLFSLPVDRLNRLVCQVNQLDKCSLFPCPALLFPALPFALPFSLPMPCPAWGEKALKNPEMSTKIAFFAVYRSENGPKKVVNTQIHKCFDKILCACLTNDLQFLTILRMSNFYRAHKNAISTAPKMQNAAKNAGLILALPTGQGENPNPDGRNTAQHDRRKG